MSLFVGNISRYVEQKDIEKEFRMFGDCTVDFRVFISICFKKNKKRENMHLFNIKVNKKRNKQKIDYKVKILKVLE